MKFYKPRLLFSLAPLLSVVAAKAALAVAGVKFEGSGSSAHKSGPRRRAKAARMRRVRVQCRLRLVPSCRHSQFSFPPKAFCFVPSRGSGAQSHAMVAGQGVKRAGYAPAPPPLPSLDLKRGLVSWCSDFYIRKYR